jgi:hypothetical protein
MVYGVYTMERKQIYLATDQVEELNRIAETRDVPVSLVIREAIAMYLALPEAPEIDSAEEHPLWGLVGAADSPSAPSDGALAHDRTLYVDRRR